MAYMERTTRGPAPRQSPPERLMETVPIRSFLSLLTEGVTNPRPVARRLIEARPDRGERFMLVGLAAALQGMLWTLASLLSPAASVGLGGHVVLAVVQFVNYIVTATVAYHLGRRFGGRGTPEEVASAIAWHAVLTAALTPLQAAALGGGGGALSGLMLILFAALNVFLLAACVAEAHRFQNTGRVAAATIGIFLTLGLLLGLIAGGLQAP
jgi:hypothetical protein